MKKLLVANRSEIAVRIIRTAAEMGIRTVAVFSQDDTEALHARRADQAVALQALGPAAYLDIERMVEIALQYGCDALHPGYGFLSENPAFARRCAAQGIAFVGPDAETLELVGDKTRARALAERCGVSLLKGSAKPVSLDEAAAFFKSLPLGSAMMIKAVAGGGGRGLRVVKRLEELEKAYARCRSEALQSFGNGALFVEQRMARARHIEVQIVGDATGRVIHLGERECSIQRRHQKLIELAPCPSLSPELRARITADAVRLARETGFRNAGTVEFLVDVNRVSSASVNAVDYAFIEVNPRLQVEHTVTEEVLGIDLVRVQLELARGKSLAELGLEQADKSKPRGYAIQIRVNTEAVSEDEITRPTSGTLTLFELPSGQGVRVDTSAAVGYQTNPNFDSLLLKLVCHCHSARFSDAVRRAQRALKELKLEGIGTNRAFLERVLNTEDFINNRIDTEFISRRLSELLSVQAESAMVAAKNAVGSMSKKDNSGVDPLAVLAYGKGETARPGSHLSPLRNLTKDPSIDLHNEPAAFEGAVVVEAPMQGTIVSLEVEEGETVHKGQPILVISAMKMEHVLEAPVSGRVRRFAVAPGDTVPVGYPLSYIEEIALKQLELEPTESLDLDAVRSDLAEARQRHAATLDGARPDAVARRRKTGQRTARENVEDLCEPDSFIEYGALAIASQRSRLSIEELIARTPADGLIAGIGRVNSELFPGGESQCAVLSYDYTVLAGTQGHLNHRKKDRLFSLIERLRLPTVIFTEGGGGRPGDIDVQGLAFLDCMAFHLYARLSGLVPLIAINSGRCFAGNAALLGCSDVVIATRNSTIGMGGPAMIEGGGLGVFRPEEVGPMSVQSPNGVVDIVVDDEAQAVRVAKKYLAYFQGPFAEWKCEDQRRLRALIPENRLRVYEIRNVIELLADTDSVLELREAFGLGMITALIRIEGQPLGVIANNPKHLAGAIDSDAADKAARFMQLCDAFDIPILFLCDTPGIMVGPEAEKSALVRHCCRMFVTGANLSVPFFTIVLRKSYGLGAQTMAGGSHKASIFTVSWPSGEFGAMGLEGAIKLGFRKEIAAVQDPVERNEMYQKMVEVAYERSKAIHTASYFEIDDVIDPADSRRWIISALRSAQPRPARSGKKRPYIDTW
ncbi:MAG: carbamoyl-phosphate synthase large subunit [Deltaproteobacteria bacterium]|nr:carbamoyl-phosphate synthase large subunit [Deltaproteobacteria bacterium]